MVGRMYTAPLVVACMILGRTVLPRPVSLTAAALVLAVALLSPVSPLASAADYSTRETLKQPFFGTFGGGGGDERAAYFRFTGLFRSHRTQPNDHPWARLGLALRDEARRRDIKPYLGAAVGMIGFHAGRDVEIIDQLALADSLLARLPIQEGQRRSPGHFLRAVPAGYRLSRWKGGNHVEDEDLAAFYERLHDVVSGDLWSWRRLRSIWAIHFGAELAGLARYRERYRAREVALDRRAAVPDAGEQAPLELAPAARE
jgi:arabinofuranosyltransferase